MPAVPGSGTRAISKEGERPAEDLEFYQQIYFHKLGTTTTSDVYVLGKDFPRIAEVKLRTSKDGRSVLATVGNGDGRRVCAVCDRRAR